MKTIFDDTIRAELIVRINTLTKGNTAQWGKMNIYQMTKHCTTWNNWILGKNQTVYKQEFLGKIFGKIALKGLIRDDKPMKRNMPAGRAFTIQEKEGDVELQKKIWIEQIAEYDHFSNLDFIHDFFGKMDVGAIGILAYKHFDHHLRQFNA